jgi:PAS domain-containing protein
VSEEPEFKFCDLTFRSAVMDSLAANIAVLDPKGEIVAVNSGWQDFATTNHMNNGDVGIGTNYLAICRSAKADPNARAALEGILQVIKGHQPYFYHEYPCHSPDEQRWFALRATPLLDYPHFVVVSHEDITERISATRTD